MRKILFILLSFSIFGCTHQWQSKDPMTPVTYTAATHRSADSLGRLRRLALMPVAIEFFEGHYGSAKDQETAVLNIEAACADFLAEEKGYEMVVVRNTGMQLLDGLFEYSEYDPLHDLYQKWRQEAGEKLTTAVIQKIGRTLQVDGVLVILIRESRPWGMLDALLNIALMNIPLFYMIGSTNSGAWIYETASGRLVWRYEYREDNATPDSLMRQFAEIENAVPRQLIK